MKCFRPVTVFKPAEGPISFVERKDCREIKIRCGQCIGCRTARRDSWALRCMLESKMHAVNVFGTLTYDDAHCPKDGGLHYPHVQALWKALRNRDFDFRYFVCGEYGDMFGRPHYHFLGFGLDFPDKVRCNSMRSQCAIYRSPLLEELWPHGFSSLGDVTWESARYCAGYTVKKVTGKAADDYYRRFDPETGECFWIEPEFARMSLGNRSGDGGIGFPWLRKYWRDVYGVHEAVIVNGSKKAIPRFFKEKMDDLSDVAPTFMDEVEYRQYQRAMARVDDNSPERLAVQEQCELARIKFNAER